MFSFGLAYLIEAIRSLLYSNMSITCDLFIYNIYIYFIIFTDLEVLNPWNDYRCFVSRQLARSKPPATGPIHATRQDTCSQTQHHTMAGSWAW